jgi:hypothetical protein
MSAKKKMRVWGLLAALSAGTALQVGANGCAEYWATFGFTSLDLCSILNCTGSTFFNFCSPFPLLVDCPGAATTQP